MKQSMSARLRQARKAAGYKTATAAIHALAWRASTYRAHENGQNNYNPKDAVKYGKAYSVDPAWLLIGDTEPVSLTAQDHDLGEKQNYETLSKRDYAEQIYTLSLMLLNDRANHNLVNKLSEYVVKHAKSIKSLKET